MPKSTRRSKLEFALIMVAVSLITWAGARAYYRTEDRNLRYFAGDAAAEMSALDQKYDGPRNSRNIEEWIIRDYFQDHRGGVFLDVGANHYRNDSNTYYLETALGWSGIAIDALPEFGADYQTHRPNTHFIAMFASDVPNSSVRFFVPLNNKLVASADRAFTIREGAPGFAKEVPTTTLTSVLDQAAAARLDFMSMDIELSEPKALAGFDIERFRPSLICIEAHPEVRQAILDYFASHGYVTIGKYLRIDPTNLYFRPLAPPADAR